MDDIHFSSESSEWETPYALYDWLNNKFHFTLDPCATHENHKCDKYYTIKENGLLQSWKGERVFMNPPYGRIIINKWIEKAYSEFKNGCKLVVLLLPARTDTSWFHDFCLNGMIRFIKGRLNFSGHENGAPFPSMIVVFHVLSKPSTKLRLKWR